MHPVPISQCGVNPRLVRILLEDYYDPYRMVQVGAKGNPEPTARQQPVSSEQVKVSFHPPVYILHYGLFIQ
jgi:hypothetical protein